jgi:phenylacetaldehyde dehydrogenase
VQASPISDFTPMFIDGRWTAGSGAGTDRLVVEDPATATPISSIAQASGADVDSAVGAAWASFQDGRWRNLPVRSRVRILTRVAELLAAQAEELAVLETLDNGKPIERSRGDVDYGIAAFEYYAAAPARARGQVLATDQARQVTLVREPLGVAALILPWNFPFMTAAWKLAPALAAGCSVVIKPAEETPLTALRLAAICAEAGVPDGVVNVVTGDGVVGAALARHAGVGAVSFTGSTEVGRQVMAAGAPTLKRLVLELGGKGANLVFPDADLDAALPQLVRAAFGHSGQMCTAASRILVHRDIAAELTERLLDLVDGLVVGPGMAGGVNIGPLVSAAQLDRVSGYIDIGMAEGARVLRPGGRLERPGHFLAPTVFDGLDPGMRIAREEIFGPVVGLMTFADEAEAVALANATEYGLAMGLWTSDLARATRLAGQLIAGTVWINTYNQFNPAVPFGGRGQSGIGRELGDVAVENFTELKSVWVG